MFTWKHARVIDLPPSFANLCPTSAPASNVMGTSVKELAGLARSSIWLFQSMDSCIVCTWNSPDCVFIRANTMPCLLRSLISLPDTYILQPMVNLGNKRVLAVSNPRRFTESYPNDNYSKAVSSDIDFCDSRVHELTSVAPASHL